MSNYYEPKFPHNGNVELPCEYPDQRFEHLVLKHWGSGEHTIIVYPNICAECGHHKDNHVYIYDVKGFVLDERFAGCHTLINENGYMGDVMEFANCEKRCRGFVNKHGNRL